MEKKACAMMHYKRTRRVKLPSSSRTVYDLKLYFDTKKVSVQKVLFFLRFKLNRDNAANPNLIKATNLF